MRTDKRNRETTCPNFLNSSTKQISTSKKQFRRKNLFSQLICDNQMIDLERYSEHQDNTENKREKNETRQIKPNWYTSAKNKTSIEWNESKGIGKPAAQTS